MLLDNIYLGEDIRDNILCALCDVNEKRPVKGV